MKNSLSSHLYAREERIVQDLLKSLNWDEILAARVKVEAAALVTQVRARKMPGGQLESFLQEYSLTTDEGMALMTLAEALLRVPDKATANSLIKDKVAAANWLNASGTSKDWIVKAAGVGLLMTSKTLDSALARIGEPVIREAMLRAMRVLGQQFVLGEDIAGAMARAHDFERRGYRMSYDILGEGARTAADAEAYFESYAKAISYIGSNSAKNPGPRPGISVKLSALHPRYEYAQAERCMPAMIDKVTELARRAASHNLSFTIDAEEVSRLEISLGIIDSVLADRKLKDWNGFGMAVQAYQKRAIPLLERIYELSQYHGNQLQVRLVKGAYWDSEIKRAQVLGLPEYPVFTRKTNTDLSYLACAAKLLSFQDYIFPMFGTHNAHTASAIVEMAHESGAAFEFQKLYGMGEALYAILREERDLPVSIYAPVGPHVDLLPYLVRRLLENGANTSFVNKLMDRNEPVEKLVADPIEKIRKRVDIRHPKIPLPRNIYETEAPRGRLNSLGLDLTDEETVRSLTRSFKRYNHPYESMPLIGGKIYKDMSPQDVKNPANESDNLGLVWPGNKGLVDKAMRVADEAFELWSGTDALIRARALENFADLLEENIEELMALCVREAGKTIPDALAEVREAVDFARYYANRGRADFAAEGETMQGPTGERNTLSLQGRGVFICISPWNFPLAIFTGQVTAALMAGNCVVAKPAEQTPLIAMKAIELLHKAGIPKDVLNLMPGDGEVGAKLVAHPRTAGVAFTGSTAVAQEINRTLAAKNGAIVPLIAETGGLNVMIVGSSALPEQVIDDAVLSALGSAGQRCSALRILCVQEEIADKIIRMLKGAMNELQVGDPVNISTDIGPVIDEEARAALVQHRTALDGTAKLIHEVKIDPQIRGRGTFFAPCAFELRDIAALDREVFGPILHVVRYKKDDIDTLINDINAKGYGLTFGIHSRVDSFQKKLTSRIRAGNIYINRSMTGAVVGAQPFGGQGLSGTGPKAGGPYYLHRFATEKVVSENTTAAGGNASLVSIEE